MKVYHKDLLVPIKSWANSIDQVMENQKDLVKVLFKLMPLAVVKG